MELPQGRRRRRRRRRAGKTISQPSAASLLHTTKETTQCAQNHKIARKERKSHQKNTCKNLTSYYAKEIFEMDVESPSPSRFRHTSKACTTTTQPCAARFLRATGAMAATVQPQTSLLAVAKLCCLAWLGLAAAVHGIRTPHQSPQISLKNKGQKK
jgi:hypothetical protein